MVWKRARKCSHLDRRQLLTNCSREKNKEPNPFCCWSGGWNSHWLQRKLGLSLRTVFKHCVQVWTLTITLKHLRPAIALRSGSWYLWLHVRSLDSKTWLQILWCCAGGSQWWVVKDPVVLVDSTTEYPAEGDGQLSFRANERTSFCPVIAQGVKLFATGTGMHAVCSTLPWV